MFFTVSFLWVLGKLSDLFYWFCSIPYCDNLNAGGVHAISWRLFLLFRFVYFTLNISKLLLYFIVAHMCNEKSKITKTPRNCCLYFVFLSFVCVVIALLLRLRTVWLTFRYLFSFLQKHVYYVYLLTVLIQLRYPYLIIDVSCLFFLQYYFV